MVIDRLGAGYLGPYGNTWIETPNFNRLAVESVVFEFAMTDAIELPSVYRSYWHGVHALAGDAPTRSLPEAARAANVRSALVTDDVQVSNLPSAQAFDERVVLAASPVDAPAAEPSQTQLALLLATAADWLEAAPEPFLLWVHARGMEGPWDAPPDFRQRFAGEEDPVPPDFVAPPTKRLAPDYDPDELLGYLHAYAGQVVLLDLCVGAFLEAARRKACWDETLLLVTSPRGYPLGEHGRVGAWDLALYGEAVHVPCFLRVPGESAKMLRCGGLVQPPDISVTISDWLGLAANATDLWGANLLPLAEGETFRLPGASARPLTGNQAYSVAGGFSALRTPAWLLHSHPDGRQELYVRPDDRWEANEVSTRCQEIVEELERVAAELRAAAQSSQPSLLAQLSSRLLEGVE
jgi:arylsulfatase A-like enzyme